MKIFHEFPDTKGLRNLAMGNNAKQNPGFKSVTEKKNKMDDQEAENTFFSKVKMNYDQCKFTPKNFQTGFLNATGNQEEKLLY